MNSSTDPSKTTGTNTSKYSLVPVSPDINNVNNPLTEGSDVLSQWGKFIEAQSTPSLFATPSFLRPFADDYLFYWVMLGTQIKGGVYGRRNPDTKRPGILTDNFVIHNGLVLADNFVDSKMNSRLNSAKFDILKAIADYFGENMDVVQFRFAPEIIDIRPFQWFNYGQSNMPQYNISIRYTSYLKTDPSFLNINLDENQAFKALSESRRQEIRYAIKNKAQFENHTDFESFIDLYRSMASIYDPEIDQSISQMRQICRSLQQDNRLRVSHVYSADGSPVASCVFALHKKQAYYLYGVTSKNSRERYSGSYILWREMQELIHLGIENIDWEGVNSPQRGWFKMSFGGDLIPYYQVQLKK